MSEFYWLYFYFYFLTCLHVHLVSRLRRDTDGSEILALADLATGETAVRALGSFQSVACSWLFDFFVALNRDSLSDPKEN